MGRFKTTRLEERLKFIEELLTSKGYVNRSDIMKQFKISRTQAIEALRSFRGINPDGVVYDKSAKRYVKGVLR